MKATNPSLMLAGAGLALAAPGRLSTASSPLLKRTGYDLCENDCTVAGLALPDKHTLQLVLESYWSEQCPPIYIGDANAPTATSRVCLDFVGTNVQFNFEPFQGYSYGANVNVGYKVMGNIANPGSWSAPPPPINTLACSPNGDGMICTLPFSDLLGVPASTSVQDLLAGVCPNGDREALGIYLEFSGEISSATNTPASAIFSNSPPCTARDSTGQCTARDASIPYIEMAYRCSICQGTACPSSTSTAETSTSTTSTSTSTTSTTSTSTTQTPVGTPCSFGTAFGYQVSKSTTLNTQGGQGCNRWGWYETPTLAELQAGISGPLYVGAGGNDISKATNVGTWSATANAAGKVTVSYLLSTGYAVTEVHVDLACLPIDKCAPGQYTFGKSGLADVASYSTTALTYPTCSGGNKVGLIVHAAVDKMTVGTCGTPIA